LTNVFGRGDMFVPTGATTPSWTEGESTQSPSPRTLILYLTITDPSNPAAEELMEDVVRVGYRGYRAVSLMPPTLEV
jgi:hypothetical protein